MAKKKKTLSDMVKAPRTIDINGQKHMLAWITPKEGKTLKALGGAGTPGPMGLPAFFFGDPGENPEAYSSESFTPSEPSEPRQVSAADFIGSGDEDDDQSQQQDQALADFLSSKNEEDRSWVENKFIKDVQKGKTVGMYQFDPRGRMTGYTHSTNPLGLGGILASLGGGTPMAYTGFGENPFASPEEDDGERRKTDGPASPSDPDKPAESGEMTQAQKDYYAKGIGPSTNIPGSEQDIYKSLIGSSESPIGSRFDREKGLLYLPDGRIIDIKTGKEVKMMSGLDIFKTCVNSNCIMAADKLMEWKVLPRIMTIMFTIMAWRCAEWFMNLPDPNAVQAGFVSVVMGAMTGAFAIWMGNEARK